MFVIIGIVWEALSLSNSVSDKLYPGQSVKMQIVNNGNEGKGSTVTCLVNVIEKIHCMVGPGFMNNC